MRDKRVQQEAALRLMRYSAAAGLGAFAFGQTATDANGEIVYTDLGGVVLQRGDSVTYDVDGDGYDDFLLANTSGGGIGQIGSVQFRGSIHPGWYGAPGTNQNYPNAGASYVQINMDALSTRGINAYYVRSFIDGGVIGPSNTQSWDETPGSFGDYYGLLSQYPGWDQNSFWNPVSEPWASNGSIPYPWNDPVKHPYYTSADLPSNEYAGLRIIDTNGVQHWAWVRFQVTIHDAGIESNNFPGTDGSLTAIDLRYDTNRTVTLYDFAVEMTPDTDIIAGDKGCSLIGDLNCDGFVGLADLDLVLTHWNQSVNPGDPLLGDPSGDGFVGLDDLDQVLQHWNEGTPPAGQVIPEPGALGLLAAGAGALALRQRRVRR